MKWLACLLLFATSGCPELVVPDSIDLPSIVVEEPAKPTGKIVVFTMDVCVWCRRQTRELDAIDGYVIEELNAVERADLLTKWGLPPMVPITVVVDGDTPIKTWYGYTLWNEIKPHAEPARLK